MIELETYLDTFGQISHMGTIWINKKYIVSVIKYKDTELYNVTLVNGGCLVDDSILQKMGEQSGKWMSQKKQIGKLGEDAHALSQLLCPNSAKPTPLPEHMFLRTGVRMLPIEHLFVLLCVFPFCYFLAFQSA